MIEQKRVDTFSVLGVPLAKVTFAEAIRVVNGWIDEAPGVRPSRMVAFTNVHMVVTAQQDPGFREMLHTYDMLSPDGRPISWIGRLKFGKKVTQVAGPDFMPAFTAQGVARGHKHFLFGGAPGVGEMAAKQMALRFPGVQVVGVYSPPFRKLTEEETGEVCRMINESGADLVWVSLGCPKQEKWMAEVFDRMDGKILLGVGYALDILSGVGSRAPEAVRHIGMEWAYRLVSDPHRLWKRYLMTNTLFLWWVLLETLQIRRTAPLNR